MICGFKFSVFVYESLHQIADSICNYFVFLNGCGNLLPWIL